MRWTLCLPRLRPACRRLGEWILGPHMFRVATAQVLSHVMVARAPEPAEVACHLHRAMRRRQQVQRWSGTRPRAILGVSANPNISCRRTARTGDAGSATSIGSRDPVGTAMCVGASTSSACRCCQERSPSCSAVKSIRARSASDRSRFTRGASHASRRSTTPHRRHRATRGHRCDAGRRAARAAG